MKKLLSVIAGFAIAIAAIAVVNGAGSPVSATSCTDGSKYTDFEGSYSGRDTMTVWTKGRAVLYMILWRLTVQKVFKCI